MTQPERSDGLTTHWEIGNHAPCPCCGRPQEKVLAIALGNDLHRLSYGRAEQFASAILKTIAMEARK